MTDIDLWGLRDGSILQTHGADVCAGGPCCVHNPSDHPLRDAPLNWRGDRYLMERVCPCGVGHPDPDHLNHVTTIWGADHAWGQGVHGCCTLRCCCA